MCSVVELCESGDLATQLRLRVQDQVGPRGQCTQPAPWALWVHLAGGPINYMLVGY